MTLTLNVVRRMLDAAVAEAVTRDVCLSFSVVDSTGAELALVRMDGAVAYTAGIARAKAQTAALMRRDSADVAGLFEAHPDLRSAIQAQTAFPITTLVGGVVLWGDGPANSRVVGGIGGSGSQPEVDLACVQAALAAMGSGS